MKRIFLIVLLALAAALAVWLGMRGSSRISSTTVTALLPKETVAFLHLPDVNEARTKWHETELYKLWQEPAVQAFLQRPLARNRNTGRLAGKLEEVAPLGMRDAFLAAIAWEDAQPKLIGGFRFKGSQEDAEKIIGRWRAEGAARETVTYAGHAVEIAHAGEVLLATAYDGDWFFAANDLPALQALLDRADGRAKEAGGALTTEENFAGAFRHMPRSYVALGYARLDQYLQKLLAKSPGIANHQRLAQVKTVALATDFDRGWIRDVLFLAMPKAQEHGDLARTSLALTTANTFLYSAGFLQFPQPASDPATSGTAPKWSQFLATLSANGVTPADWKAAFGGEFGLIGDWAPGARMPALLATLPVQDAAKANELVATLTAGGGERPWTAAEKNGVRFFSQAPANPMVPLTPTVVLAAKSLIAGLNLATVEEAVARSVAPAASVSTSAPYQAAVARVPTPANAFLYLDTALFYTRLDEAIRPMLIMAGAFVPAIAETVDLGKLPASEVITQHLGPVVLSQSYENDGYVAHSIGPISIYQAAVALAAAIGAGSQFYQQLQPAGTP